MSSLTNAEITNDPDGYLSSFNSNGFTLIAGSNSSATWNLNTSPYVAWCWRAGGAAVANTAGTITITHGVLQPNNTKAEGIDDILLFDKYLTIYPNPASNDINIAVSVNDLKIESVQLYDLGGKLLFSNPSPILKNNIYSFSMITYSIGNYVLKINSYKNNTNHTSAFTITKSN